MRYASITERLAGLGSGKWDIHLRGRKLAAEGKPVIELTIGEPDIPPDDRLLDVCNAAMRAGRTRYSNGRASRNCWRRWRRNTASAAAARSRPRMCWSSPARKPRFTRR